MATTSEPPTPTREMILAEPAGARLNAWVAEYVLGWPTCHDHDCGDTCISFVRRRVVCKS